MITILLILAAGLCLIALVPLGVLAYFGGVTGVIVLLSVGLGTLFFGGLGAGVGLALDSMTGAYPAWTMALGVGGGAAGAIAGGWRAYQLEKKRQT